MKVRWEKSLSDPFYVSNGVRQGGVLSSVLFSVYLDGLLQKLADSGVGCHWGNLFAGAVCYADDIVLLVPCPSALRILLDICSSYADTHGLAMLVATVPDTTKAYLRSNHHQPFLKRLKRMISTQFASRVFLRETRAID